METDFITRFLILDSVGKFADLLEYFATENFTYNVQKLLISTLVSNFLLISFSRLNSQNTRFWVKLLLLLISLSSASTSLGLSVSSPQAPEREDVSKLPPSLQLQLSWTLAKPINQLLLILPTLVVSSAMLLRVSCALRIALEIKRLIFHLDLEDDPKERENVDQNCNGIIHIRPQEKDNMVKPKVRRILGHETSISKHLSFTGLLDEVESDVLTLAEVRDFFRGVPSLSSSDGRVDPSSLPFKKDMEISHLLINTNVQSQFNGSGHASGVRRRSGSGSGSPERVLLQGFYAQMSCGMMLSLSERQNQKGKVPTSVKKSKRDLDKDSFKKFIYEFKLTSSLGYHENILQVLGACSLNIAKGIFTIVFESCESGSLKEYLSRCHLNGVFKKSKIEIENENEPEFEPDETLKQEMLRWSYEIASGMNFIASNGIIHGALTTERILLTSNRTIKLTEFGVAPYLSHFQLHQLCQPPSPSHTEINSSWPWRNLPKETFEARNFSTKSDVYSFAVVIWEIFQGGKLPFEKFPSFSQDFLEMLGGRKGKPPLELNQFLIHGDILHRCLSTEKEERPDFENILLSMYKLTRAKRRKVSLIE